MHSFLWVSALTAFVVTTTGCTHVQLRSMTVRQSQTLTDIYEQQVLDNLAMFVHDGGSLPYFAFPNQGGSDVTDSIGGDGSISFNFTRFTGAGFGGAAGRNMSESWTLTPVYDPRRLELMRCAYQQVLVNAGMLASDDYCPNPDLLQRIFYVGTTTGDSVEDYTAKTGRTTPTCFAPYKWFNHGCQRPDTTQCCGKFGEYCGTYVWLCPDGQAELSKLTMVILDYAFNESALPPTRAAPPTMQVTQFLSEENEPTTREKANKVIRQSVEVAGSQPAKSVGDMSATEAGDPRMPDAPQSRQYSLPPIAPANTNLLSPRALDVQRRFLAPQR